jgi:Protein of unknown function (DUF3303)
VHFLVVETYTQGPGPSINAPLSGRMLPCGLSYLDSWIDERRFARCFQLMETEDPSLFDQWIANWNDLMEFEIVPVVSATKLLPA